VQWAGFAVPDWTFSEPAQYMPSPFTDTLCWPGETANVNGVGRFICRLSIVIVAPGGSDVTISLPGGWGV